MMYIYMNNYLRISVFIFAISATTFSAHAQQDPNLVPIATAETSGYDTFNAYVLKNSIKRPNSSTASFSLLLTGVSTVETKQIEEPIPVSGEDRVEEYDLNDGRVILSVNMNCKKKTSTVVKVLSIDPQTGKLKEQIIDSPDEEQDRDMNKALYKVVCT